MPRCAWATVEPNISYHDHEWGVPVHDDCRLFEMIVLDAAQAGLSWITVLRKRDRYRQVYDQFDPVKVAAYGPADVQRLLADPGIIRNRLKIESSISNARRFLEVQQQFGSFDAYIWQFVSGKPRVNRWKTMGEVPARTEQSDAMSKDLKKRGFRFVGSTICYAFMQAAGMVNDHTTDCPRHRAVMRSQ